MKQVGYTERFAKARKKAATGGVQSGGKICAAGKRWAQNTFDTYPSAYANAYASKICAGKIKDPSGVKRKDFKGPKKAMGGMIDFNKISQDRKRVSSFSQGGIAKGCGAVMASKRKKTKRPKQKRAVA